MRAARPPIATSSSAASDAWGRTSGRPWSSATTQDFSADEIAEMLGIPVGTAKSRIHYATEALRAALEADGRASAALIDGRTA